MPGNRLINAWKAGSYLSFEPRRRRGHRAFSGIASPVHSIP